MSAPRTFDEILDAVEELPADQREELVDVVLRRLAEQRRRQIIDSVHAAEREFCDGDAKAATVDQIMRELDS